MTPFLASYIECALWSSMDESTPAGGYPMDKNYSAADLAPETLATFTLDCGRFQQLTVNAAPDKTEAQIAHDFWLTRNGHGAGFWDGDYPELTGELLTAISKGFGECFLYLGDDGKIYAG